MGSCELPPAHDASWAHQIGALGSHRPRRTTQHDPGSWLRPTRRDRRSDRGPFRRHIRRSGVRRRQRRPGTPAADGRLPNNSAAPASTGTWVGTWSASPAGAEPGTETTGMANRSVRNVVHTSVGGTSARVTLSNLYGQSPLSITQASIAVAAASGTRRRARGHHAAADLQRRPHGRHPARPAGDERRRARRHPARRRRPDHHLHADQLRPGDLPPARPPDLLRRPGRPGAGHDGHAVHRAELGTGAT